MSSRNDFLAWIERRNGFLVDVRFDPRHHGPKTLDMEGQRYYRFMDYIYIPKLPHQLSPEEILAVSDLRLQLFDYVVDKPLNRLVMSTIVDAVRRQFRTPSEVPLRVLDFGCGPGFSSALFRDELGQCDLRGVDISPMALEVARKGGLLVDQVTYGEPLPFAAGDFNVVFAAFVLHFHIEAAMLIEIRRVLDDKGIFVFNLYNEAPHGLWESLSRAGFVTSSFAASIPLPGTHRVYCALPG